MIKIENLTKRYGKTLALDNINLELEPGTITVLLGPNGAGKSTLMKSVAAFLKYEGNITIGGYSNHSEQARRTLGYIAEMPGLYPNLNVGEHMEFVARAYSLTDYKEYSDELLKRFELDDKKKKLGDELSKGMQQKLNICIGLLPKPKVLMLDEPMIGLDPHAIKEIKSMIEKMKEDGYTILVSTHIIDSIDMLWDRTIIMKQGKICADVRKDELDKSGESLEKLFFDITEGGEKE